MSSDYLNNLRDADCVPGSKNSVVVDAGELYHMRQSSVILSAAEKARRKREEAARKAEVEKHARDRKTRMLKMEEDKKRRAPIMTETEEIENANNNQLLSHAKASMDEELDDVKHMNQMMLYAKCATIRDMQIRDRAKSQQAMMMQEKRLDTEMEVARIKDIKMVEERERIRAEEQRIGAQCIIKQIQEREAERVRQQEVREHEASAMIKKIKMQEVREEQDRQVKVVAGRKMLEQVMEANNAQARAKLRLKQQEMEEDSRIVEYIKAKEAREAAADAEGDRVKQEKEVEVARMRAQQEKAQDRQSQIDELRAKRYQEANDRAWRTKQMEEAQKQQALWEDMAVAREVQRREKAHRMAEQAMQEREEYQNVLEWNRAQAEVEELKVVQSKERQDGHREELLDQISIHEREKALARQKFLQEGKQITKQMKVDKRKLQAIKAEKLRTLQQAGVPVKYQAELAKKKVMVPTIH